MGTFYRSRHELVFAFKKGTAEHINNFELGQTGRYRTNVWEYAGVNSFGKDRDDALAMHPTVKPVALVADAIKDCSKPRQIVLDPFGGSGTTLIAAHKVGRHARLLELDPHYCDTIVRRWQQCASATGDKHQAQILSLYEHDLKVGQQASDEGTEDIVDRANNSYNREFMFALSRSNQ